MVSPLTGAARTELARFASPKRAARTSSIRSAILGGFDLLLAFFDRRFPFAVLRGGMTITPAVAIAESGTPPAAGNTRHSNAEDRIGSSNFIAACMYSGRHSNSMWLVELENRNRKYGCISLKLLVSPLFQRDSLGDRLEFAESKKKHHAGSIVRPPDTMEFI
jgi:hypothetical protein